jgi:hypothetical protein
MIVPEEVLATNMTRKEKHSSVTSNGSGTVVSGNWSVPKLAFGRRKSSTTRAATLSRKIGFVCSNNNDSLKFRKWFPSWKLSKRLLKPQHTSATLLEEEINMIMEVHTSPNTVSSHFDDDLDLDTSSVSLTHEDFLGDDNKINIKDDSFDTLTTETVTSSSDHDDDSDDLDHSNIFDDCGESSIRSVRFADEEGLPMEHVFHHLQQNPSYDHEDDTTSELIVLCLSPQAKKFEFLHVAYYTSREGGEDHRKDPDVWIQNQHDPTKVSELMVSLPGMCTDRIFSESSLDTIYRINKDNGSLESLVHQENESDALLGDCNLSFCEMVVAATPGSTKEEIAAGVGPLLANVRLMKTLRRARRSRRGLKFVAPRNRSSHGVEAVMDTCDFLLRSIFSGFGLYDEENDDMEADERFEQEFMRAVFMVTGLTFLFSICGIH